MCFFKRIKVVSLLSLGLGLTSLSTGTSAIDMKVDRVTINTPIGGSIVTWEEVTFQQAFGSTPVVIVTPTNSNGDPATVRIRNVTTTGFEVGLVEAQSEDGQTADMTVDYFAAETGIYTFAGAVRMVVGAYSTTTYQGRRNSGRGWDDVNFPTTFGSTPAVVAQIQTINSQPTLEAGTIGSPFMDVAIRNVRTIDMDVALERAETNNGTVVAETIGYVAMESGDSFTLSGIEVQAFTTPDNIRGWDNGCFTNNFPSAFAGSPLAVSSQNRRDGGDGGWVRRCSISSSSIGLTIDEDQANDSERSHTTEQVGVFAMEGAFHGTRNGRDIEAGSVTIPGTAAPTDWTTVSFPNEFNETPMIFALPTDQGSAPAALRVRNVSTTSFDIAAFEPNGGNGAHPVMEVDYVAIIPGEHTLPNGDVFEVGSVTTNRYQAGTGGSTGTFDLSFENGFSGGAAMLLGIQSINSEPTMDPSSVSVPWLVTTTTSLGSSSARIALERAESPGGTVVAEELAYFIAQDGANDSLDATDGSTIDYEMFVTPDNIQGFQEGCDNNSFTDSYASPYAIATQSSRDGNNGGWARRCNLESTRIGLFIDEDQDNDSERSHTTEEASVFVFSQAFEAEFNTIDHYAIFLNGSGGAGTALTCEAERIVIGARDAAGIGATAAGRTITITATSTTPGWLASDSAWSLSSGTGAFATPSDGVATYTFDTNESSVELFFSNISEADIDIDVIDGFGITDQDGVVGEDPVISFLSTGLRFYNDANNDGEPDGTDPIESPQIAGDASGQLILRAIETNSSTGACESRLASSSNAVNIGYECINPGFCHAGFDMNINVGATSTPIAQNDNGSVVSFTPVSFNFDAEGDAPFTMQYFDVGEVRLHAQFTIPASGSDPAIDLSGSSDSAIVRPATFVITRIEAPDSTANPGTTTAGTGFVPSDSIFTVEVEARNSAGRTAYSYGFETPPESVTLRATGLVMPDVGDLPALIDADSFTNDPGTPGFHENTSVRWPEAGSFTMRAEIADADYMGTGLNTEGSESGTVGRFYPAELRLTSGSVTNGCAFGNFTYMSDSNFNETPADLSLNIEALSANSAVLGNYDDTYPTASFILDAENADDGTSLASRLESTNPGGTWVDGQYQIIGVENFGFARATSGASEVPDGPYQALQIGLIASDPSGDGVDFDPTDLDFDADSSGDCSAGGTCDGISLGNLDMRFGRLYTENVHGPESADLSVPFEIQFWSPPQGFVRNTNDNCTILPIGVISFDGGTLATDTNRVVTVGGGTSTGTFLSFTPSTSLSFSGGDAGLVFSAPGVGNTGSFDVDIDLSTLPWLRSDWDSNGDSSNDLTVPSAEISFGRYRGHDRVIYWEEQLR